VEHREPQPPTSRRSHTAPPLLVLMVCRGSVFPSFRRWVIAVPKRVAIMVGRARSFARGPPIAGLILRPKPNRIGVLVVDGDATVFDTEVRKVMTMRVCLPNPHTAATACAQ
jgi:hypothetical protein